MKPSGILINRNDVAIEFSYQLNTKGKAEEFLLPINITTNNLTSFIQFIGEDKFYALLNTGVKHFYRRLNKAARDSSTGKLDAEKFKRLVIKGKSINSIDELYIQHMEISKKLIAAKGKDIDKLTMELDRIIKEIDSLRRNRSKI